MKPLHEWPFTSANFEIPVRYSRLKSKDSRGAAICLHGYQDHALSMVRRLGWADRDDLGFDVLAVNAPFPVPIWTDGKFTEAYAWYFHDATRGIAVGSPAAAADAITRILAHEALMFTPLVICGFSQGGLLAPVLAAKVAAIRGVIGIGTGFPAEIYADLRRLTVHAVHGADDETWPLANARAAHQAVRDLGFTGEFVDLPGVRHRLTPAVGERAAELARATLQN